jgi:protein SCO1/2
MIPRQNPEPVHSSAETAAGGPKFVWRFASVALCVLLYLFLAMWHRPAPSQQTTIRTFPARGIVEKIEPQENSLVISHAAIPSYMEAMTMPFKVRHSEEMTALKAGDQISFQLSVTDTESWIDHIVKLSTAVVARTAHSMAAASPTTVSTSRHPLLDYAFTNELGQPIRLRSFDGQALAITFFFTRCPLPDFCPRLSRNFAEASRKLGELPQGPTNWHFLSVSFDPAYDTPAVLKAYADNYHYDSQHWSFLTGSKDKIAELARLSNVEFQPDSGFFNHNFRTLIIDASGRLQMVFPTGGDLSEAIVSEILKATAVGRNKPT